MKSQSSGASGKVSNLTKIYVLDTNVLIHDPYSLYAFEENDILIPFAVLEELDKIKTEDSSRGKYARVAVKIIEKILTLSANGKKRGKGLGKLIISSYDSNNIFKIDKIDNYIISIAKEYQDKQVALKTNRKVILVSKDINMRIKATSIGVVAQDYQNDKTDLFEKYGKVFKRKDNYTNGIKSVRYQEPEKGKYIKIVNENTRSEAIWAENLFEDSFKIHSLNPEQDCALIACMDKKINFVALSGVAGTGKTLLALMAGLLGYINGDYEKIIVIRHTIPVDQKSDLGFTPGDISQKINPWMAGIMNNVDFILSQIKSMEKKNRPFNCKKAEELIKNGIIEIQTVQYARGATWPKSYIIIDESQNTTRHIMKTLVSRSGEGSKVVLTGDLDQMDDMYLDKYSNGFSNFIRAFINENDFCFIKLIKVVRSEIAEKVARLL